MKSTLRSLALFGLSLTLTACPGPDVQDGGVIIVNDSGVGRVDAGSSDAGNTGRDAGTQPVDSGTGTVDSGTGAVDSGTGTVDSGTGTVDSGTGTVDSGTGTVDSGTGTVDSGTGTVDSGTGTVDSGTGTVDSGTGTVDSGTGTVDSGTGGIDAGLNVHVIGTRIIHYVTPNGVIDVPGSEPLTVYSLNGSTFTPASVSFTGDGGFAFNVTSSPYYVAINGRYLLTTATSLDLGASVQGRPYTVPYDGGEAPHFTVNATGLVPYAPNADSFVLSSDTVNDYGLAIPLGSIGASVTTLSDEPMFYLSYFEQATLEASKGDSMMFSQVRSFAFATDAGTNTYNSLIASGTTGAIDVGPGLDTPLTIAMAPLTAQAVSLDWRGSSWAALSSAVHPSATFDDVPYLTVMAVPGGTLARGWVGYMAELIYANIGGLPNGVYSMVYGNPKATWAELGSFSAAYAVPVQLTGSMPGVFFVYSDKWAAPSIFFADALTPAVAPVTSLTLDGFNAQGTNVTSLSTTPIVGWASTAPGDFTHFQVRIRELVTEGPRTGTRSVATIVMNRALGTSLRVPSGVLLSGHTYILAVAQSRSTGPYSSQNAPYYDAASQAGTEASSSQFTVP